MSDDVPEYGSAATRIAPKAVQVAAQHAARDAAFDAELTAEAEVLSRVRAVVAPALPALVSRIPGTELHGLPLQSDDRDTLILTAVGKLGLRAASAPTMTAYESDAECLADGWNLERIVTAIVRALDAQLGGAAGARTAEATTRAARLRTVLELLERAR